MITNLMRHIARLPISYPKSVIAVSLILTVVAVLAIPRLYVSTDRNLLAGKDNEVFRRREEVNELFGTSLAAAVVIKGREDRDEVKKVADALAVELLKHPDYIRDVFHKADINFFERHALLFLPLEKVKQLPDVLNRAEKGIELLATADSMPKLLTGLAELMEDAPAPEEQDEEDAKEALGFFSKILDDFTRWFEDPKVKSLSIADELWSAGPALNSSPGSGGYLTDSDGKNPPLAVLFIQPKGNSQDMETVAPLTDLIRRTAAEVLEKYPGVQAHVTGMPAVITDEMRAVTRDCVVAGVFSGIGVLLVFIIAFRSLRISMFLVLPLGVGLVWSAGFAAMVYGHLTLITSYFAAVLFGLGVAFTIHIVARFHEALLEGQTNREAVETALTRAGPGVVVGGGTTALAFLAIAFSEFKGFAEMGIISGVGVTLILITNLTLLPAALLLWHPGKAVVRENNVGGAFWVDIARSRVIVPTLAFGAMILGGVLSFDVGFDYAVESLLPSKAESVVGMRELEERTDFSMNYSIALASSMKEAEDLRKRFSKLSTVSRAESLSMFVPVNQKERIEAIRSVGETVRDPISRAAAALPAHLSALGSTTASSMADAFKTFADTLEDLAFDAKRAGRKEAATLDALAKKGRETERAVLTSNDDARARELERIIFSGLKTGIDILQVALDDKGFGPDDLPEAVRGRYQSKDKKHFAVIVFPNGDIGQRDFFEEHVAELLSVSKNTTGHPVTHLQFTKMVHKGFVQAVVLASIAVILLIVLDLRDAKGLALALIPVLMGLGWTALIMALTGFKFNYANLMALPILIGTGVDYGVHLAHRARQEGSIRKAARTTGRAIALTGLTTLIGFGSLLLGEHWGVRSLGLILVIGITSSLLAALIVIPGLVRPSKENKAGSSRNDK